MTILIEQKYNEQYEIICCCNDFKRWSFVNIPNVKFVSCVEGIFYYFFAGYVFNSFGKIPIVPGINKRLFNYGMEALIRRLMQVC